MNQNLIKVNKKNIDVLIDLRYSTNNNFTKEKVYFSQECYIHKVAYEHLHIAVEIAKKQKLILKIFDAYRPPSVQRKLWECLPDPNFIAPPDKGSPHSRGVAVDLTLTDSQEKELDMGTGFDEFSRLSYHGCMDISMQSYQNRLMLLGIMTDAGWDFYRNEWWHYQLFNSKKFPLINEL